MVDICKIIALFSSTVACGPPSPRWRSASPAAGFGAAIRPGRLPARRQSRVVRSSGGTSGLYRGTVPGIPELCLVSRPDGEGRFYFGSVAQRLAGRRAMPTRRCGPSMLGPKGTRAAFDTRAIPGQQWHDTLRQPRCTQTLDRGWAEPTATVMIAHEREGFDGNVNTTRSSRAGATSRPASLLRQSRTRSCRHVLRARHDLDRDRGVDARLSV